MEKSLDDERKPKTFVPIRGSKDAKVSQRKAVHEILATEEEYTDMQAHISLPNELTDKLDEEVKKETQITTVSNVMNLLYADIQGYGSRWIAGRMGLTLTEVNKIRQSKAYKGVREALLKEILATSRRVMEVSAIKAVKTLTECMDSYNEKVRMAAATEVLDRIGLNGTQKVEVTNKTDDLSALTTEQLEEILKNNTYESTAEPIDAVDVDFEDVIKDE